VPGKSRADETTVVVAAEAAVVVVVVVTALVVVVGDTETEIPTVAVGVAEDEEDIIDEEELGTSVAVSVCN
jgi:hypothetical protein